MDNKERLQLQIFKAGKTLLVVDAKEGKVRFNLTEMAKSCGTDPAQWLRTDESKRYIECVSVLRKRRMADLVTVAKGGAPHEQGTWANDHLIAIEFARWLDPMLSIQVNDLVWKLLTKQAVVAEPIGDVWPVTQNGRVGYPRREILIAAGYSPSSGTVEKLRKRYPEHHYTIARIPCVSAEFACLRMKQGETRQLELRFRAGAEKGIKSPTIIIH